MSTTIKQNWRDEIYLDQERRRILKRDEMELEFTGENFRGQIERVFPEPEQDKRWDLFGKFRDKCLIMVFWSADPARWSNGCICVRESETDADKYIGLYLRCSESDNEQVVWQNITLWRLND